MIINLKLVVLAVLALFTFSSCDARPVYAYDDFAVDGAVYRGLDRSVQNKIFDHVERYDLDALYSIIFDDRDYLVIEWNKSTSALVDRSIEGYSFVLFDEKVSFSGEDGAVVNNYIIGLGDAEFSAGEDIVDRSINFIVENGVVRYSHTSSDFYRAPSAEDAGVEWVVGSSEYAEARLLIGGATSTINYASYSTDFDGQLVSRQWLKIKDYSKKVGGVSDYEKIVLISVAVVGYLFVGFFKFRS